MKEWNQLPVEIQEAILEEQVKQGNSRNPNIFIKDICSNFDLGGFS